ncbi:MAG: hypothetical protein K2W85_14350 [Phycisphaerales bacterium]|nr:hypothetical protein [Phycisphaerales bacterium]
MIGFISEVVRVLRLPCREHTLLFSKQLDEPLSRATALGLRIHIVYCRGCSRYRRQLRRLHELARSLGTQLDSGEPMPDAARERVLRRIREDS